MKQVCFRPADSLYRLPFFHFGRLLNLNDLYHLPQFPQLVPNFEAQYEDFKKTIPDTVEIIDGGMVTTKEQAMAAGAELRYDPVEQLIPGATGQPHQLLGPNGTEEARTVIIATGAAPRPLGIDREEELTGRGVSYCATCDGNLYRGRTVAVVGGGDTALTDALVLANYAETVYLIHRRAQFRGSPLLQRRVRENPKIQLRLDRRVQSLSGEKKLDGLTLTRTDDGSQEELACDGLFVAVGIQPRTGFLQGVLDLDEQGRIRTHRDLSTSVPGIYAAGDCRDTLLRQVVTAAADGAIAAVQANKYIEGI